MKKTLALALALLMLFSFSAAAANIGGSEITPMWNYMDSISYDFTISANSGTAWITVERNAVVTTKIEASIAIYEQVGSYWILVDGDYVESAKTVDVEVSIPTESDKTYKAVFEVIAYSGTNSETFEDTIIKTAPSVN